MQGTIGSGKTTWARNMKRVVEADGGRCESFGTDPYARNGMTMHRAIYNVANDIRGFLIKNKDFTGTQMVIIDTCGEHVMDHECPFGQEFTGWSRRIVRPNFLKDDLPGYLAWSLRNVLARTGPDESYWVYPGSVGTSTCIEIHGRKAKMLGWRWNLQWATLETLRAPAEAYAKRLDPITST